LQGELDLAFASLGTKQEAYDTTKADLDAWTAAEITLKSALSQATRSTTATQAEKDAAT
jgi:hypothetical protein